MSGVLRRGSLSFDCNLNGKSARGNYDANLNGGYRETKPRTPEISIIAFDLRCHLEDLKKGLNSNANEESNAIAAVGTEVENRKMHSRDLSQDKDGDEISNYLGHFGRWQFIWTFLLSLWQIPTTLQLFVFVFQTAEKDFWCARPTELTDMNVTIWKNLTQPNGACSILNINVTDFSLWNNQQANDFIPSLSNSSYFQACTAFEFETWKHEAKTLVEEFNLVCDQKKLLSVVEMSFLAGAAIGSVASGWISDRFGRKQTLMGAAFVQMLFGTIVAFSTSLPMFMTLRVVMGFASMTVAVVSFVLVVELVSGKWRTIIGILNILPVALAYVLAAAIAYFIRDWRTLQLVISVPWLALISTWYCVPESPRWLLARGRLEELFAIVERAAAMNGHILPANYRKSLEAVAPTADVKPKSVEENLSATPERENTSLEKSLITVDLNASPLVVVFSKRYCKTTCLNLIIWLTLIMIYFGLTLHLSNLGGNIYLNTAVAGAVEAVSICLSIFFVLKFGIRRNLIAYMLIPGVCCLATNFMQEWNGAGVIGLAMISKCVIGANNAIIPTFTAMQYPTVVRNFGVGMGNLAAGVALVLVPYMWLLEETAPLLPMTIMGIAGLIGAGALMLMKDVEE